MGLFLLHGILAVLSRLPKGQTSGVDVSYKTHYANIRIWPLSLDISFEERGVCPGAKYISHLSDSLKTAELLGRGLDAWLSCQHKQRAMVHGQDANLRRDAVTISPAHTEYTT